MPKYFIDNSFAKGENATLSCSCATHLIKSLRVRIGDQLILFDGKMNDYVCTVVNISRVDNTINVIIKDTLPSTGEPPINVFLFQALPKSDKMDYIIQKSVELGVHGIVPISTRRVIIRGDIKNKIIRYNRISQAASEQCMRGIVPTVYDVTTIKDALDKPLCDMLHIVAYENEHITTIKLAFLEYLEKKNIHSNKIQSFGIWIGPEGGFCEDEVDMLIDAGAVPVTLGPRVLRTETAGMVALVQLLSLWEC